MATDSLDFASRLSIGKQYEDKAHQTLNTCLIEFAEHTLNQWSFAGDKEDIHHKIDMWVDCTHCDKRFSSQFKFRETGGDIISALIMPYPGDVAFRSAWKMGVASKYIDRDLKYKGDFYVCQLGSTLFLTERKTIHELTVRAVDEMVMCARKMEDWKWFTAESGVQLHLKQDKGQGYSEGQWKLIAYIPQKTIMDHGEYAIVEE
jgi:hypothetical protein